MFQVFDSISDVSLFKKEPLALGSGRLGLRNIGNTVSVQMKLLKDFSAE